MKLSDKSLAGSNPTTSTQPLLLIDGDLFLYRAAASAETEVDWGDDIWSLSTDLKQAKQGFMNIIEDICGELNSVNFIVSDDKDMKTIPCRLYRPMSREHFIIDEQEADRNFLTQCLTGDITDGYKGLEGIGEKRAATILGNRPCWELVEAAYVKACLLYTSPSPRDS